MCLMQLVEVAVNVTVVIYSCGYIGRCSARVLTRKYTIYEVLTAVPGDVVHFIL